ncbi:MAG: stress protein [Acidobacteria bacterium]|nr:MAG: stress protein [Acidobacteriota bacterium]PYV37100.1 MAG: stress protein [Acidobacteriota bacterium]
MIEHLVLFKVKSEASPADAEKMVLALRSLAGRVPSIRELHCGTNFSNRNQGFTHGLLVTFRSRADLDAYSDHPEHQRVVAECVRPIVESIVVVDFESS